MGYVQKRNGNYRARYKDPVGHVHSNTFDRKMDAERFLVSIEADKLKGNWIDPRFADMPVARWAEEFMALCRRLAPIAQETYQRDLDRYVLPRFGAYRLTLLLGGVGRRALLRGRGLRDPDGAPGPQHVDRAISR